MTAATTARRAFLFRMAALAAGILVQGAAVEPARAEGTFPNRPVTLYVGHPAGGPADLMARTMAPYIAKHLGGGARVIIINRKGAGGEEGFAAIADATPDGHAIGLVDTPAVVTIPIERPARYSLDRLDPLAGIVANPAVLAVAADSPHDSLDDLVAFARANPYGARIGTPGLGSNEHFGLVLLDRATGARFVHRPLQGEAANRLALLRGETTAACTLLDEGLRLAGSGAVRLLGVLSGERMALAPNLPTFREQGHAAALPFAMAPFATGIAAPQGLPPNIRARLIEAITRAAGDPDFQAAAARSLQTVRLVESRAFAAELREQDRHFRRIWREGPWLE